MSTPQVLIVGAGPAGLVTALSLAQNGIQFRIIEKATSYHTGSRGFGLQPRTFELFEALGFVKEVQEAASEIPTMRAYKLPGGTEPIKTWDLFERVAETWPDRPYPNGACLSQTVLEDIMRKHLAKYGVNIELGHELISLEHTSDSVTATILDHATGKTESASYSYLVGADGAKGITRKLLGLTFDGETRESDNMVWADFEIRGLSEEFWHFWGNPGELTIVARPLPSLPGNSQFAVAIMGPGLDLGELTQPEKIIDFFVKHTGRSDLEFGEFTWISTFRPNIRIVSKFQEGRCFVVGDAAHVHPPTGGQGLNCGIQDSFNLAWKLALVLKGKASPDLLLSYNDERLPVIAQMLYATTQLYSHEVIKETSPLPEASKPKQGDGESSGWFRWRNNALFLFGINYRFSGIVLDERDTQPLDIRVARAHAYEGYGGAPVRAGDRAPEAPGLITSDGVKTSLFKLFKTNLHTILVFLAPGNEQLVVQILQASKLYPKELVQTIIVSDDSAYKSDLPSVVDVRGHARDAYNVRNGKVDVIVVRPDGIIGAVLVNAEGLVRYFSNVLKSL